MHRSCNYFLTSVLINKNTARNVYHQSTTLRSKSSKSILHNPNAIRFGWSKDALLTLLPMTSTLISSRGRPYENIGVGYCINEPPKIVDSSDNMGKLRTDDSWLEIVLPFADHTSLRDSMMRDDHKTIRYGRLFELLDSLAGTIHSSYI